MYNTWLCFYFQYRLPLSKEIKAKTIDLDNISDEQLRFKVGTLEFNTENNLNVKIMEPPANMKHSSTIVVVMRQRGESDPRIQILQNCGSKNINGVTTPSLRTCPYCGALVQHTEACKNMTCPACSKGFCFVCLKPRKSDGVLQCICSGICVLLLQDKQVYQDDNGWITSF